MGALSLAARRVRHPRTQRGLGFWGWLFIVGLVGTLLMLGFRLLPHVLEYRTVSAVMDRMAKDPTLIGVTRRNLLEEFKVRLERNNVNGFDLEERVDIDSSPKELTLTVAYEVREPVYGNLFLLLDFDKTILISRGG
jgi:hypothetical protein